MKKIKVTSIGLLSWLPVTMCVEATINSTSTNTNYPTTTSTHISSKAKGFEVCAVAANGTHTTDNKGTGKNEIKSPLWSVVWTRHGTDCEIVDGGRCVSDGAGEYGPYEACHVQALRPLVINTTQYDVPNYDYLSVDGFPYYRSEHPKGPTGVYLEKGIKLRWHGGSNYLKMDGFKVCATPAAYSFWSVRSGKQYCEITAGGRCVRSRVNKYGDVARCQVVALRPLVINTTYYVADMPTDFIDVGGVKYNYTSSSPNGVYLDKDGVLGWSMGTEPTTTTTTTTETPTNPVVDAVVINVVFFVCTLQSFGGLVYIINRLRKRKRLQRLHSRFDDVSKVDATVEKLDVTYGKKNRASYYLNYTFTGTNPSRGPFRMTRKSLQINSDLYHSLYVGGKVAVCYSHVDPKNCALVSDIEKARKKIGFSYIFPATCMCIWLTGVSVLPIYFVCQSLSQMDFPFAAMIGLFTLAASAISIGLCFCLQFLVRLCARRHLVLEYGEAIESHTPALIQLPCESALPVAVASEVPEAVASEVRDGTHPHPHVTRTHIHSRYTAPHVTHPHAYTRMHTHTLQVHSPMLPTHTHTLTRIPL